MARSDAITPRRGNCLVCLPNGPKICHRTLIAMSCVRAAAGESWKPPTAGLPTPAAECLCDARAIVRISLLLHAQALVRASGTRIGGFPRWLRHAGRAHRNPDAGADPQAAEPDSGDSLRRQLLE